ncbi:MAG: GPP34 family phosphoprotein [Anaerolineales bacterium]|jgi:hypothetical protein|nr:GPP34 family phosphoprotein [Anaerolineales bacterium]
MKAGVMLTLYENLFLIGIHEEKVTVIPSALPGLLAGLSGALLADLAFSGRVETDSKHRIHVAKNEPTGDELLDGTLAMIHKHGSAKKIGYWLDEMDPKPKTVVSKIFKKLVEKGVLKDEDGDHEWITPYPPDSTLNASAKFALVRRLRTVGLARVEPELEDLALLALLRGCNKLDLIFFKDERKIVSRRIYELLMSEALRTPAVQILQELEQALANRSETD